MHNLTAFVFLLLTLSSKAQTSQDNLGFGPPDDLTQLNKLKYGQLIIIFTNLLQEAMFQSFSLMEHQPDFMLTPAIFAKHHWKEQLILLIH